ncbi:PREDICTED: interferon regulatory factor 8-like [Branchiostoma belcheri]|uniref:Interferon regulatory factor 8-like n=1 Tax=Branchiostoma belcheri TaxID=7741 RepID=A0A6P4ZGR3_BRABE|nr:PREDICTED: interferon regulatory factor 8-like [Branchiostoma belcheri]
MSNNNNHDLNRNDRKRLRKFLLEHLERNDVQGLTWVDRSQGIFRIGWRHAGRDGYDPEVDGMIFRLWAELTGKHKPGQREDPTAWKTRLRNALRRLPDFAEQSLLSKPDDPHDPYRVYKFVPTPTLPPQQPFQAASPQAGATILTGLGEDFGMKCDDIDDVLNEIDPNTWQAVSPLQLDMLPDQGGMQVQQQPLVGAGPPQAYPVSGQQAQGQQLGVEDFPGLIGHTDVDITVEYRGRCVVAPQRVSNPRGLRIFSGSAYTQKIGRQVIVQAQLADGMYGPQDVTQFVLPDVDRESTGQKQFDLTKQLLEHTERGVVLEFHQNDIYARRLCRSKIFWEDSNRPTDPPLKLTRDQPTKVFDYQTAFIPALQNYVTTDGAVRPSPDLRLCVGQVWDRDRHPFKDNLITVTVTHLTAARQLEVVRQVKGQHSLSLNGAGVSCSNEYDKMVKLVAGLVQSMNIDAQPDAPSAFPNGM